MDKEEAMKILKNFHDESAIFSVRTALETLHPELKESEDEKTRKEIIYHIKNCDDTIDEETEKRMLAWLENIPYTIDHEKREGFHLGYKAGFEKQGESSDQIHYWTEEEIEPIISDYLRGAEHYGGMIARLRCLKPKSLEKQSEQKPANKVEPKFKVGDWITDGDYTWKIVEVKPLDYILQSQDGNIVDDTISHVDEQFHSFTIEDAKDGDVLVGGGAILMFRRIGNTKWDDVIDYHCYYDCYRENFIVQKDVQYWGNTENNQLNPSTKEQRDILFQKMKEAGYEWDAEKKKLNKISQRMVSAEAKEAMYDKPAWSEEDEEFLRRAINAAKDVYPMTANWLKSLKERCAWKPSDEQMADLWNMLCECKPADHQLLQDIYYGLKRLRENKL